MFAKYLLQAMIILVTGYSVNIFAGVSSGVQWSYIGKKGPANWGHLSPAFSQCSQGKIQSPINISKTDGMTKAPFALSVNYQPAPMMIVNDGEIKLMINHVPTIVHKGHAIQLDFPETGPKEILVFEGREYYLKEFHLHTPGETGIYNDIHPMEIHLVHQSEDEQVAVLAVLVKSGKANPVLQNIIDHLPKDRGIKHLIRNEKVNPAGLMPKMLNYYHFDGSLTTPPCTEGLQWVVISDTITASAKQIALLKRVVGGDNARPIQPVHQRKLYYSTQ